MKNCSSSEGYQPGISVKVAFKLSVIVWVEFEHESDVGHCLNRDIEKGNGETCIRKCE